MCDTMDIPPWLSLEETLIHINSRNIWQNKRMHRPEKKVKNICPFGHLKGGDITFFWKIKKKLCRRWHLKIILESG